MTDLPKSDSQQLIHTLIKRSKPMRDQFDDAAASKPLSE